MIKKSWLYCAECVNLLCMPPDCGIDLCMVSSHVESLLNEISHCFDQHKLNSTVFAQRGIQQCPVTVEIESTVDAIQQMDFELSSVFA